MAPPTPGTLRLACAMLTDCTETWPCHQPQCNPDRGDPTASVLASHRCAKTRNAVGHHAENDHEPGEHAGCRRAPVSVSEGRHQDHNEQHKYGRQESNRGTHRRSFLVKESVKDCRSTFALRRSVHAFRKPMPAKLTTLLTSMFHCSYFSSSPRAFGAVFRNV